MSLCQFLAPNGHFAFGPPESNHVHYGNAGTCDQFCRRLVEEAAITLLGLSLIGNFEILSDISSGISTLVPPQVAPLGHHLVTTSFFFQVREIRAKCSTSECY